jgi:hypothetical protein
MSRDPYRLHAFGLADDLVVPSTREARGPTSDVRDLKGDRLYFFGYFFFFRRKKPPARWGLTRWPPAAA